jgi:uncharacterized protein (TIGR02001 family)
VNKKTIAALVVASAGMVPAVSMAELSANIGFVTDYIFRGYYQEDSSAYAGLDYESSGFYIGTWGADVGDGLETDLYFGYGGGSDSFTWSVGFTGYYYTEDTFDDTYQEVNLGIGAGGFAFDLAIGQYDNFGDSADYTYAAVSYTLDSGTSFKIAQTDYDTPINADGIWFELGHSWSMDNDLELALTFLYSPDGDDPNSTILLSGKNPLAKHNIVFGITKGFSLGN